MTFNPSYAELLGRELQKDRMREAERQRLIDQAVGWNPGPIGKLLIIIRSRWSKFRKPDFVKIGYVPITKLPKKSPSL